MERWRRPAGRATPSSVAGNKPQPQSSATPIGDLALPPATLPNIQAIIDGGGQIMVGTIKPINGAAIAHDGTKTLVMLRRRPQESIPMILERLDTAIAMAIRTGSKVDEINSASSDKTYTI